MDVFVLNHNKSETFINLLFLYKLKHESLRV